MASKEEHVEGFDVHTPPALGNKPGPTRCRRGYAEASLWELVTFGWCSDLVRTANERDVTEEDVKYLLKPEHQAQHLATRFDAEYARRKVGARRLSCASGRSMHPNS